MCLTIHCCHIHLPGTSKQKLAKIRAYLSFVVSRQNQASFAKCYSKLLFVFDCVQRETKLYCKFKMITRYRLHRRQERHLESFQVYTVTPTYDDMILS